MLSGGLRAEEVIPDTAITVRFDFSPAVPNGMMLRKGARGRLGYVVSRRPRRDRNAALCSAANAPHGVWRRSDLLTQRHGGGISGPRDIHALVWSQKWVAESPGRGLNGGSQLHITFAVTRGVASRVVERLLDICLGEEYGHVRVTSIDTTRYRGCWGAAARREVAFPDDYRVWLCLYGCVCTGVSVRVCPYGCVCTSVPTPL
eukprot:gene710-biopygen8564